MLNYNENSDLQSNLSVNLHEQYMKRCFQLAKLGEGYVAPNPMVGAVLVYEDRIIGEGYHQEYGKAHAEVNCLNAVAEADKSLISKSTLYVSLEPCAHYGKTPPCVDLILKYAIPKVVIAVKDTFAQVNGRGIEKLRANNVEVITGVLEDEGKALIHQFLYFHQYQIPYITLKFAKSADGYIGVQGREVNISNALALRYTHRLRAQHQAIVVGKNTVLTDNPRLTVRFANGHHPTRIVLGNKESIPSDYSVFNDDAQTLFFSGNVKDVVREIASNSIISIMVEGGANVLQQFIEANLWNEAHLISTNQKLNSIAGEIPIIAPNISGVTLDTIYLEDNTVHVLKNPDALSLS